MQNFSEMAYALTLMNVAIYDSINSIEMTYEPFTGPYKLDGTASKEAATAEAAFTVLSFLFQSQIATFSNERNSQLSRIRDSKDKESGITLGNQVARKLIEHRRDGINTPPDSWRPSTPVGVYVPTSRLVTTYLGDSQTWTLNKGSQFRPPPPPILTSSEFGRDYEEVRILGGRMSTHRTKEQSYAARYWTMSGVHAWNRALSEALKHHPLKLAEHARVRALLNMAVADSYIAAWDAKFAYEFWRPVTAIRSADRVEGAELVREASWRPLIETPLHPDYPSGHSANAGAAVAVLVSVFGETLVAPISIHSDDFPQEPLVFKSFQEMKTSITNARVHGGIHFRFSCEAGEKLGWRVGDAAVRNYMQPIRK